MNNRSGKPPTSPDVLADPRASLYIHEASHAAVALHFQTPCVTVEISANQKGGVIAGGASGRNPVESSFRIICIAEAGAVGERLFGLSENDTLDGADARRADDEAKRLHGLESTSAKRAATIKKARREAARILRYQREAVIQIATLLRDFDRLGTTVRDAGRRFTDRPKSDLKYPLGY